jgi:hypothetical protein
MKTVLSLLLAGLFLSSVTIAEVFSEVKMLQDEKGKKGIQQRQSQPRNRSIRLSLSSQRSSSVYLPFREEKEAAWRLPLFVDVGVGALSGRRRCGCACRRKSGRRR